ncbi:MAG: glycine betaine ABC transporter substrate-binding protein [Acidobacteriota bacterium]
MSRRSFSIVGRWLASRSPLRSLPLAALVITLLASSLLTLASFAVVTAPPAPSEGADDAPVEPIVVASKNFAESRLLAELFAQLLEEHADLPVERRLGLASTQVCFEALRGGAVDMYPEYTGTGLVSLLGMESSGSAAAALATVRRQFLQRWDLHWLAPLGFENAYELAVPRALAEERGLARISDLVAVGPELTAGFGYEFGQRPDGLPGLETTYGLRFGEVRALQQGIKYRAAAEGEVQVLDVYTTDGRLLTYDLVVLEDDRDFFPPYQAVPLVRGDTLRQHPQIAAALDLVAGVLDEDTMRQLNLQLQEEGATEASVARSVLLDLGLVDAGAFTAEAASTTPGDFLTYLWSQRAPLLQRTLEHLTLTAAGLALGLLVAIPLGLLLERRRPLAEPVIRLIAITQTIPSIALLAFMIPLFGIGTLPAVVALWIYSLFPILRNTYTGVRDASPAAVDSGRALGMTESQILRWIRLPLALPTILAGVRTAAVLTVGTATLAAFIGAGGLGEPIVTGLQLVDTRRILSGALPAALLAVLVDLGLGMLENRLRPKGR